MADQVTAAAAINPFISVRPLTASAPERDPAGVPPALANMPAGTVVEGFVVNRDPQNNPVLRTPAGDLVIQSDLFLKTGSSVVFRVDLTQASRARIVTIDGLTPSDYAGQQTRAPSSDTVNQTPLPSLASDEPASSGSQPAPPPQPLDALLLTPATPTKAVPSAPIPTANFATPTTVALPLPTGAATTPVALPPALLSLPAGTPLQVTVQSILYPQAPVHVAPIPSQPVAPPVATLPATTPPQSILPQTQPAPANPPTASTAQPVRMLAQPVMSTPLPANAASPAPAPLVPQSLTPTNIAAPPPSLTAQTVPTSSPSTAPAPAAPIQAASLPPIIPAVNPTASPLSQTPMATPSAPTVVASSAPPAASPPAMMPQAAPTPPATPQVATPTNALPAQPTQFSPVPVAVPVQNAPAPQARPVAPTTSQSSPNSLPMTVIGHEANGATILHSPLGTIQTYLPQKLPIGTRIQAEVTPKDVSAAPALQSTPLVDDSLQEITSLARDWKSLGDAITYLQATNPPLAAQLAQQLPQAGNQLTSGLLFFLAAVKNGDPRQWLGNRVMQALDTALPAVADKLRADMTQLQQFSAEAGKGNWSVVMLPILQGDQLEQARLFFRHDREPGQGMKKGGANHRFILEVDLSHMGSMQLDGFVRKAEQKHQFDLVIRSARPLSPQMSNDIRQLFENAVTAAGFNGYLAFQQGSQHFVRPMAGVQAAKTGPADGGETNTILA